MIRELKSKKTGKIHIVDDETYQQLSEKGTLKKYTVIQEHIKKMIIPDELIKKVTKKDFKKDTKNTEETTLNEQND